MNEFEKCLVRVEDASEELFRAYAARNASTSNQQSSPGINRFVDQAAKTLELELPMPGNPSQQRTLEFTQGPHLLSRLGTTGSVLWDSTLVLISILARFPGFVTENRTILELGCGIGVLGTYCASIPGCGRLILTDGEGDVLKIAKTNLDNNLTALKAMKPPRSSKHKEPQITAPQVDYLELDWKDGTLPTFLVQHPPDLILATDVLYNEFIVPHFVSCLKNLCSLGGDGQTPWLLAQELRNHSVHELFLTELETDFEFWRFDPSLLPPKIAGAGSALENPNYVVYFGKLRQNQTPV